MNSFPNAIHIPPYRRGLRAALLAALLNVLIAPAAWANNGGKNVVINGKDGYIGAYGSSDNTVYYDGSPPYEYVAGGYSDSATNPHSDASGNTLTLLGGTVNRNVYGGFSELGKAINNTVNFIDGTVGGGLMGGMCGTPGCDNTTGNTLNVEGKSLNVDYVANFATINFAPGSGGYAAGETALNITSGNPIDLTDVTVTVSSSMAALKVGDTITLISKSVSSPPKNSSWGRFEFSISGGALIATVKAAPATTAAAVPTLGGAGLAFTALALPAFATPALRRRRKQGKEADTLH